MTLSVQAQFLSALLEAKAPYSPAQWDQIQEIVSSPERWNATQLGQLERLAKKLGPDLEKLPRLQTDASRWMCAAQHEAAGQHSEAAQLLDGIWEGSQGEERAFRLLASARNLSAGSNLVAAARRLAEAIKSTQSYRTLSVADKVLKQLQKRGELPSRRKCRIALLGSVTLDFWLPALRAQCFASGIEAQFHVGPFGQIQQELLNPESKTASFKPDIVVLASDFRSFGFPEESNDPAAEVERQVSSLRSLWKQARGLGAFVIQLNSEIPAHDPFGHLSASLAGGFGRMLRSFNLKLWEAAQSETGVAVLDIEQIASKFGKLAWNDAVLWHTAKQYPAAAAIPAVTHHLTALFRAILGLSAKCVAVDLDGTLWGGVIGEDGLAGIQIGGGPVGEAHAAFQKYLKGLASRGILLAACSKNNPDDALQPFREHRGMVLKETDFAVFIANWETKDRNLREIAKRMNIGLDAVVFVDDNPMERGRVRQNVPEVEVVELPTDPSAYIAALDEPLYFEALTLTKEDRARGESIRQNQERESLQTNAASVDDYLADLQMVVELHPFLPADLPRIVQLINKTNQFNMTTRRTTDADIQQHLRDGCYTQSLRVADRFGDSGLTGVLIGVREGDALRIHTWLMSCRVMGRRLEEAVMAAVVKNARSSGIRRIVGEYIPTPKNDVVADLYSQLGFEPKGSGLFERSADTEFDAPDFLNVADHTNSGAKAEATTVHHV